MKDVTHYITNPLNAFAIIKRATSDVKLIGERFPEQSKEFLKNIEKLQPTDDDLAGSVDGLIRLQIIYKLKSEDFANGIIDGEKTRKSLSTHDLFVIGEEVSKLHEQEYFALEYLNMALNQVNQGLDIDEEVNLNILLSHLISIYFRTGDFPNAIKFIDIYVEINPGSHEFTHLRQTAESDQEQFGISKLSKKDPFSDFFVKDGRFNDYKENILYSQVCRGNLTMSLKKQSELRCRYVSNSPFAKLARFKIEEANLDPYIILFIDVISDQEIEFLKEITKPKSSRAKTFSPAGKSQQSYIRVAQLAWHDDNDYEIIRKISQRIEVSMNHHFYNF